MILIGQIFIILLVVHILTVGSFFILKDSRLSKKFKSSTFHPASIGNSAAQIGGLVIIPITLFTSLLTLNFLYQVPIYVQLIVCMPVLLLFVVGIIDDFHPISAIIRLSIHIACSISITVVIYNVTSFSGLENITPYSGLLFLGILMVLAISWMINTVNFIDGMDLFLVINILPGCLLFGLLYFVSANDFYTSFMFMLFASSLLGFVWYNRPNASIYMGDAGTLSIGFILGAYGVYILAEYGSIAGFIPFTYILTDTTLTLFKRIFQGHNPLKSHNHHAYQVAAKNGKSHNTIRAYCGTVTIINTVLAFMCFELDHVIFWQCLTGGLAFLISTALFFFFKKPEVNYA